MKRQANIELLRGVLMLMIVFVHLTGNGVLSDKNPLSYTENNWLLANIIDAICYPAVNCFILISGYFGLRPTLRKFLNLEIPIIAYGVVAYILFDRNSVGGAIHALLPVLSKSYWFFTSYFMLLLVSPILNTFIDNADKKKHELVLIVALSLFVLIPSFSNFRLAEGRGMDFVGFAVLYLIGRYLGKYDIKISGKRGLLLYSAATILCFSLTVLLAYKFGINRGWKSPFYAYNNVFVFIQSIGLFYVFKSISITNDKWSSVINKLSPSFFFVYIIHENPVIHSLLYNWIGSENVYYSTNFLLHTLGWGVVIFVSCVLIDIFVRRALLAKMINLLSETTDKSLKKVSNRILKTDC